MYGRVCAFACMSFVLSLVVPFCQGWQGLPVVPFPARVRVPVSVPIAQVRSKWNSKVTTITCCTTTALTAKLHPQEDSDTTRRTIITVASLAAVMIPTPVIAALASGGGGTVPPVVAPQQSNIAAPKFVQEYSDFTETPSGWRYRDVSVGSGTNTAQKGDRVVFDWSGYTIGYFGRPFQAKGGPVGGAFDKDLDLSRTIVGSGTIIKAVEEALMTMKPGGVRQVVVPYGDDGQLSYPLTDLKHELVGPKPSTFSGQRALNFVLENPRLDRTLLFNVKLIRIDRADGKGGFVRGDKV